MAVLRNVQTQNKKPPSEKGGFRGADDDFGSWFRLDRIEYDDLPAIRHFVNYSRVLSYLSLSKKMITQMNIIIRTVAAMLKSCMATFS